MSVTQRIPSSVCKKLSAGLAVTMGALNFQTAEASCPQGFAPTIQGMASSWAAGVSFKRNAASSSLLDPVRVKAPLAQSSFPQPLDPAVFTSTPNFTLPGMFPELDSRGLLADLQIDAMSTNNPMPNVDNLGWMGMGNLWAAVMFSVSPTTVGGAGTVVETRSLNTNVEHGSDIYGYYVQQSITIAPVLRGRLLLEVGAPKIRANEGGLARDMDGLDFAIGVLAHRQNTPKYVLWQTIGEFYFSVSGDSATALDAPTTNSGLIKGTVTNPATIYKIVWDGSKWSDPEVEVDATAMGLIHPNDDIDALSMTNHHGGVYVFSTTLTTPSAPQIQVYKKIWGNVSFSPMLRDGAGDPIEELTGLSDDPLADPDALCVVDPESIPGIYDDFVGIPVMPPYPPAVGNGWLGLSTCLSGTKGQSPAPDTRRLHVELNGFFPGLPLHLGLSFNHDPLAVVAASGGNPGYPGGSWTFSPFGNAPLTETMEVDIPLPGVLVGTSLGIVFLGWSSDVQYSTTWASLINTSN